MVRFISFIVLFLLCVASSSPTKVVDVETICKKAKNYSFCITLLKSKAGGAGGDLVSLASYTIGVARTDVSKTINLIKTLIAKSGGNPKALSHYKNCLDHFGMDEGALGEIVEAQQLLKKGDYGGVNAHASGILTDVDGCLSGDSPTDPPFHDTSSLPKYAAIVEQVSQIILIITNFLLH
ncbi:pectinesterase inhibitor-like protein [Trifolium pratense]|uniref:Pectinesterase inhibitor-like protein n=1 Tax=Trifolium pratense TaxID=57577 RepID=A0A2K3JQJ9_TRIPR|nr:pectinesterase inhibitor-like protein [Trifolium pratense]